MSEDTGSGVLAADFGIRNSGEAVPVHRTRADSRLSLKPSFEIGDASVTNSRSVTQQEGSEPTSSVEWSGQTYHTAAVLSISA